MMLYLYTGVSLCLDNLVNYAPDDRYDELKKFLVHLQPFRNIPANATLDGLINIDKNQLSLYRSINVGISMLSRFFRSIMFGGQKVFLLDVFIIITGAYVSSITMIIVALSIEALANSYMEFNKEIEENIKSGKLQVFSRHFESFKRPVHSKKVVIFVVIQKFVKNFSFLQ